MSVNRSIFVSASLLVVVFGALSAEELAELSPAFASQRKAKLLLEQGIAALGDVERVKSIQTVAWELSGTSFGFGESPRFSVRTSPSLQNNETVQVDLRNGRLTREVLVKTPGFTFNVRYIIDRGKGYYLNLFSGTYGDYDPSLSAHRAAFRTVPQLFLKEALDRGETLRSAQPITLAGRNYEALSFVDADQQIVTLYFNADSKLLYKSESVFQDSVYGDSVVESIFEDYYLSDRFQVPARRIQRQNGTLTAELKYHRIVCDQPLLQEFFRIGDNLEKGPLVQWPQQVTAEPLGRDAYLIRTPYFNVMALGFSDYTLIVEAPENASYSGMSDTVLRKVAEVLPGKPVKFVTFSHYHRDHAGGLREYIARGVNIITSPENVDFVDYISHASYTLKPDQQAHDPKVPRITLLRDKKYVLSDGARAAQIYDFGPWGHCLEELVVYVPDLHLLFEGDLFASGYGVLPAAQDGGFVLARKIKEYHLDVQYIVGVHGMKREIEQLQASIEKRRRRHAEDPTISLPD